MATGTVYTIMVTGPKSATYDDGKIGAVPLSLSKASWIKIMRTFPDREYPFAIDITVGINPGGWLNIEVIIPRKGEQQ